MKKENKKAKKAAKKLEEKERYKAEEARNFSSDQDDPDMPIFCKYKIENSEKNK